MQSQANDILYIPGAIAARAVLQSGSRAAYELWVEEKKLTSRREGEISSLVRLCAQKGVHVLSKTREELGGALGEEGHGGVLLLCGERIYASISSLVEQSAPLYLMEGVEDPYSFGHAVRSLYAAGAGGLFVPPRNWTQAAGVVARSSAGASERLPIAIYEDFTALADALLYADYTIWACDAQKEAVSLYDADLSGKMMLMIGGEKRGLSAQLLARAQSTLCIPYARPAPYALPTNSAASIIAFEVMRKRLSGAIP